MSESSPPAEPEPVTISPPEAETASNPASNGCEEATPAIDDGAPAPEEAEAAAEAMAAPEAVAEPVTESCPAPAPAPVAPMAGIRGRVPPGGHSSGPFW